GRKWTAVIITKCHESIIYDVEVAGYGSITYSSNKMKTFSSPDRSIFEDLLAICLRRELLEEMITIFLRPQYFFYE
ncbi:unnamed protein product, partial [Hymenolepis diminuta]